MLPQTESCDDGKQSYEVQTQFSEWNIVQDIQPSIKLILEWKLHVSLPFSIT
jgi:hypothetical protein